VTPQGGDHGGIEGPLGACVAIYGKVGKREGPFYTRGGPSLSLSRAGAVEKPRNHLIRSRIGHVAL
jgi:hypothetical protein